MRKALAGGLILTFLATVGSGCAMDLRGRGFPGLAAAAIMGAATAAVIIAATAPPPPPPIRRPPPREGYVWIPGYWGMEGGEWVWYEGFFERERPDAVWVPGQWVERPDGQWEFHQGYWRAVE